MLRTLGKGPALVVLVVDVLKGVAAILLARWFFPWLQAPAAWLPWAVCLCGLAALLGHSRSIWLGFTGGKSAATGLGVLLALSWPVGAGVASVFLAVLALGRIVSLASMLAAVTAALLVCLLPEPLAHRLLVVAGGLYVIALHRDNIARLLGGTEPKVGRKSVESGPHKSTP